VAAAVAIKNSRRETALVDEASAGSSLLPGNIVVQFDNHWTAIKVKTAKFLIVTVMDLT
jgi:hypothetical protein